MKGRYGFFLVRAGAFFARSGLRAGNAFIQCLPVHRCVFQICQADALHRRILVVNGIFRFCPPVIGGGNPQPQGKGSRLVLVVDKNLAGG